MVCCAHPTVYDLACVGDPRMSDYRRRYVPGGTYFFTVVTNQRRQLFGVERNCRLLGDKMRAVCRELPFQTVAAVLMRDHLHVLWTLPRGDADYSTRWQRIKREFTYAYLAAGGRECCVSLSNRRHRNRGGVATTFLGTYVTRRKRVH